MCLMGDMLVVLFFFAWLSFDCLLAVLLLFFCVVHNWLFACWLLAVVNPFLLFLCCCFVACAARVFCVWCARVLFVVCWLLLLCFVGVLFSAALLCKCVFCV